MKDNKHLTFIDFFSGVGGFRLGFEQAGFKCIGFCEKDRFAVNSYREMFDTNGEWYRDDITKIRSEEIPYADIWCGGSPCQDVSIAGRRKGLSGNRSGLFFKFIDLLKGKDEKDKPEWVVLENVKGLLSSHRGFDFTEYLHQISQAGYDAEWKIFNSKDYGVPQNRERVYIIGHLRTRGRREILPVSRESSSNLKQIVAGCQGERVYDPEGLACTLTGLGGGGGGKTGLYLIDQSITAPKITKETRCITSRYTASATKRTAMNSAVLEICEESKDDNCKAYPVLTPERVEKRQNGRRIKTSDEPMFTLTGQDRHGVMIEMGEEEGLKLRNGTKAGYQIAHPGDSVDLSYPASKTRRARVGKGFTHALSCSGAVGVVVWKGKLVRIRRLTPKECFRLQGFPDELFEKARLVNSDAQLYKQAGNAVTVNVAFAVASALIDAINQESPKI